MNLSKLNFAEKLIGGYMRSPPLLKEQAVAKLAIQLCQNVELKKSIILESEALRRLKYTVEKKEWDILIEKQAADMCKKLHIPPALNCLLIVRIGSIAQQLFSWSRQQALFDLSPLFADSLLIPSDWTVETRLDEKKIAERLVQDERIPVCQRYKMACFHYLETFIHSLWNQISTEGREDLLQFEDSKLVALWSYQLAGKAEELVENREQFLYNLFASGVLEGSRSAVFHCWNKLHINTKQRVLPNCARKAFARIIHILSRTNMYIELLSSPEVYMDILCFLLTQKSEEELIAFFQENLQIDNYYNALLCFSEWPYLDLLLPIIKKLWSILPEAKYAIVLLDLANSYSNNSCYYIKRNGYVDYYYGSLMIELLEEAPDNFKRYIFGDSSITTPLKNKPLLCLMIRRTIYQIRNIRIFKHAWQHAALDEKLSFFRSKYGSEFCCVWAVTDNLEVLNSMLIEIMPECEVAMFRKHILRSEYGKDLLFEMIAEGSEDKLNTWLCWGFPSKQEIFQYILKVFFRGGSFDFKDVFQRGIEVNCLDNVIQRYSPSEDAGRKLKTRFVKMHSRNVCIHFILLSKWQEMDQYFARGFPSEGAGKRFKKWFVEEYAMDICETLIIDTEFEIVERFLTVFLPSEEAKECFRQELFFFSGVMLQWIRIERDEPIDTLIKWFKLGPEATLKFKRDVLFCSRSLDSLFTCLSNFKNYRIRKKEFSDYIMQKTANVLRWGLADEETVMTFKDVSNVYLKDFAFADNEARQWVEQSWDELLNERLFEVSEGQTQN